MPTTNFDDWLDVYGPETEQDRDDLLASVMDVEVVGEYITTREGNRFVVKTWGGDSLILASKEAHEAFIATIQHIKVPNDLDERFLRNSRN